jgi:hypothetical protein
VHRGARGKNEAESEQERARDRERERARKRLCVNAWGDCAQGGCRAMKKMGKKVGKNLKKTPPHAREEVGG